MTPIKNQPLHPSVIDSQLWKKNLDGRKRSYPLTYRDLIAQFHESEMNRIAALAKTHPGARELVLWGKTLKFSRFKRRFFTLLKQSGIRLNECYKSKDGSAL